MKIIQPAQPIKKPITPLTDEQLQNIIDSENWLNYLLLAKAVQFAIIKANQ